MLVEDDVPTRSWLESVLETVPDLVIECSCGTVNEALQWLREHEHTNIVLTDLGLPDGSGLQVIQEASMRPGCEVLVLSIFGDEHNVLAAIDAGASGYLLKDGSHEALQDHLRCLRDGGSPLSPRIARTLIRRTRSEAPSPPLGDTANPGSEFGEVLSGRERDVLTWIGKGFSYAEVAENLHISTNTVRTHVRRIYEKLSVNSKTEALYEYNRLARVTGGTPIQ